MHTSTPEAVRVTADRLAKEAIQLFRAAREGKLHHRPPADRSVFQRRRNIISERATPWHLILEQSLTDLADGIAIDDVLAPYRFAMAALMALASEATPEASAPSVLPLVQRETRAQAALDEAQQAVIDNPNNVTALDRALALSASYRDRLDRLDATCQERRARLTLDPRAFRRVGPHVTHPRTPTAA